MGTAPGIKTIKEARRRKLAALLETASKFELGKRLDMNPDYLWQMAKGQGASARGISDKTARHIEEKLGKPANWMEWEGDDPPVQVASQSVSVAPEMIRAAIELARRGMAKLGVDTFDPEELEAAIVVSFAIDYLADDSSPALTDSVVIDFTTALEKRNEERRKVGSAGDGDGKSGAKEVGRKGAAARGRSRKPA